MPTGEPGAGAQSPGTPAFPRKFPDSDGFQRTSDTWVPALLQGFGLRVFQGAVGINDH